MLITDCTADLMLKIRRADLEALIEAAIDVLDRMDDDPDLEESDPLQPSGEEDIVLPSWVPRRI